MKKLAALKSITHFVFLLSCVFVALTPAILIMHFASPESMPEEFKVNGLEELNAKSIAGCLFLFIGMCLYLYALYLFRKILDLFSKRKIFNDDVVVNLDKVGKSIIAGTLVLIVPPYLYNLIVNQTFGLELELTLDEPLFILGLGLFFMVLSEVFKMAKDIKEENDLTV